MAKRPVNMNICILGNAGAGKTIAAKIIADHTSARVIESDILAHNAYLPSTEGWHKLVKRYGESILLPNGEVDRQKLGQIIFQNPTEEDFLKSVVDPIVRERIREEIEENKVHKLETPNTVLFVSYLMIERSWYPDAFHHVIIIIASPEKCVERLKSSRSWSEDYAISVLHNQLSSSEIIQRAKELFGSRVSVINNDHDLYNLKGNLIDLVDNLLNSSNSDAKKFWAQYLENESNHQLAIFLNEEKRASWLLTLSGAILVLLISNKQNSISSSTFLFLAISTLFIAILFSLLAIFPIEGYRHYYRDLTGSKYRTVLNQPIDDFLKERIRPAAWTVDDYLLRVQYHFRSHWLIAFRRKRLVAWAIILTLLGVIFSLCHIMLEGV